ncbi:molybdopterin oxidoreductase family protein [Mangrovimicrobium sediminis]|uniref:Molybdopterin oxidoreductase family protein n=1 Tax=Mangrovimicrobium sediminis TaxID=2562682 RepID=A0A4Z0LZG8_9GAMM|nr:molybdopterin-dependent oxidoreductase [Haliea sp. SAOS-164]TGD72557.1 molybdopterin oxidoreductase family protein [Haliea sp. SAOS-164]
MTDSITTHYRACHLCEAICGLEIRTRGEEILSIRGDREDPFSRGHVCPKAVALQDLHEDPDRLRQPVKRVDGGWQVIGWDEAFATVGRELSRLQRSHGDDAVAIYAGNPNVHNYGCMTHGGLLRKALATRNTYSATSLDQLPHQLVSWALYGHQALLPVPDIDHTQFMLIFGANPVASNGSIMTVPDVTRRLKAIRQRGGRVVVVDPRRTETAAIADRHHFIRPGSDAFVLLAILHTLFDEDLVDAGELAPLLRGVEAVRAAVAPFTADLAQARSGIAAEDIRALARDMARAPASVCYGRMGVSVQAFGSVCQWAIQVINILCGSLDRRGGAMLTSPAFGYIRPGEKGAGSFGRWHSRVGGLPEFGGELPSVALAQEMLTPGEGQVRGLVTIAGNPVLSAPNGREMDRALAGLEFMAAIDLYINETTRHADIILPPTGPLEHDHYDVVFHRLAVRDTARYNAPVFEPAADTRHDWQILNALAVNIAAGKEQALQPLPAPDVLLDLGLQHGYHGAANGAAAALSLDKLREHPHGIDLGPLQPGLAARLCTADGAIHLDVDFLLTDLPRLLDAPEPAGAGELLLIGRRHVRSNNSWMHNFHRLVKGKPRWQLLMHPEDMRERGLHDGAQVVVRSRVGELETEVLGSDEVMPGVVSLPHGWGHQRDGVRLGIAAQQGGVSCNDVTDQAHIDPVCGNAAFNGLSVRVAAAPA